MTFRQLCGAAAVAAGALAGIVGPASAQLASPYQTRPYGSDFPRYAEPPTTVPLPAPYVPPVRSASPYVALPYNPPLTPSVGTQPYAAPPTGSYMPPPSVPASAPQPAPTAPAPQTAQASTRSQLRILDEIKIGGLAHDIPFGGHGREGGADVNVEILFASPEIFKYIWSPRPHFGVDANTGGKTSNYYAGLAWDWDFYQPGWTPGDGFFFTLAVGGAIHDGKLDTTDPNRKSLGSRILFREGLDFGYRFNPHLSVSAFVDHISNANLAHRNEGLTNAGMRFGYRF